MISSFKAHPLIYAIGILPPVGNKGDEAIYISSLMLIKRYLPNSVIALAFPPRWYYEGVKSPWTLKKEVFAELSNITVGHPLDTIGGDRDNPFLKLLSFLHYRSHPCLSNFLLTMLMSFPDRRRSVVNYIKKADVNVTLSFPFESANILFCYSFIIPKLLNERPLVSFPISLTMKAHLGNRSGTLIREALMNADMIFTRGRYTTKWLLQKLRIPPNKVLTSADPSFLLNYEKSYNCKIRVERDSAALVPHPILTQDIMIKIIDVMLKFFDHIYIVPTEVRDIEYVKLLNRRVDSSGCTVLDTSKMPLPAIKSIFQKTELVVTSRSHAGIFALTSGTPIVMINRKSDLKFMDILGHYDMEHYFLDVESATLNPAHFYDTLTNIIRDVIHSHSTIRKSIIKRNRLVCGLAELPGRYLKELVSA
ncbi:MAG: polysaccharide pyruvyl transferase family protein [Desulfurococcaceae archaeon]